MYWTAGIFATRSGSPELPVSMSSAAWESRLKGTGRGQHTIPLAGAGIPQSMIRELSKGNKYTFCQMWGTHVSFAGVIQRRDWDDDARLLTIDSTELRAAYMNSRQLYGVPFYDPTAVLLQLVDNSHSAAARTVINTALPNSDWELPIDLPADGAGSFNATWFFNERLKWEDHLAQIEDDGCEIDFRPYLDGSGYLRWETRVADKITSGDPVDLAARAPGSRVTKLRVVDDYTKQATGLLAFGKGGASAPTRWAANGADPISVRDTWVSFPDLDEDRLQGAVDALSITLGAATEQWSYRLNFWPDSPAIAAPGQLHNLWLYGNEFIPDGKHEKRVVGVRGDLGVNVSTEVQDAA